MVTIINTVTKTLIKAMAKVTICAAGITVVRETLQESSGAHEATTTTTEIMAQGSAIASFLKMGDATVVLILVVLPVVATIGLVDADATATCITKADQDRDEERAGSLDRHLPRKTIATVINVIVADAVEVATEAQKVVVHLLLVTQGTNSTQMMALKVAAVEEIIRIQETIRKARVKVIRDRTIAAKILRSDP